MSVWCNLGALHIFSEALSVPPLCPLCLCGEGDRFRPRRHRDHSAAVPQPMGQVANKAVPQRGSVWVADIMHAWPDTIHRQPTRYRVVVLTSLPPSLEKLCQKNEILRTCYTEEAQN